MSGLYIDWDNVWTTVISGTITGLVVGAILGLVGYLIWKKQHLYSKKLDAYTSFINALYRFSSMLPTLSELKIREIVDDNFLKELNKEYCSFLKEQSIFIYYFGAEKYFTPIREVIEIHSNLIENRGVNMNKDELDKYILNRIDIFSNIRFK